MIEGIHCLNTITVRDIVPSAVHHPRFYGIGDLPVFMISYADIHGIIPACKHLDGIICGCPVFTQNEELGKLFSLSGNSSHKKYSEDRDKDRQGQGST